MLHRHTIICRLDLAAGRLPDRVAEGLVPIGDWVWQASLMAVQPNPRCAKANAGADACKRDTDVTTHGARPNAHARYHHPA